MCHNIDNATFMFIMVQEKQLQLLWTLIKAEALQFTGAFGHYNFLTNNRQMDVS